jgi:hypothetical protein
MVKNNSLENLFGSDITANINKVNKPTNKNLTNDETRLKVYANIITKDIDNFSNVISRNYYDLNSRIGDVAITYQKIDNIIEKSFNRVYTAWFNLQGDSMNIINNYDDVSKNGYRIDIESTLLKIVWFTQYYEIPISISLNTWYAIVVQFNQRQETLEWYIFGMVERTSNLTIIDEGMEELEQCGCTDELYLNIDGGYGYITNIRLIKDYIPKSKLSKFLNQYVIKDTSNAILIDNSDMKVITKDYSF